MLAKIGIPVLILIIVATKLFADSQYVVLFDNIHWTFGYFLGAVLAWSGLKTEDPSYQSFKRLIAAGLACLFVGQVFWDFQVYIDWNPYPGPSDAFFLLLGVLCVAGFWQALRACLTQQQFRALPYDILTISISLITFTLVLYLPRSDNQTPLQIIVTVMYPVFLLSATAMAILLTLRIAPQLHWSWLLTFAGLTIQGYAWLKWNLLTLEQGLGNATLLNFSFSLSAAMMGLGISYWQMVPIKNERVRIASERLLFTLPIVAGLLIVFALVIVFYSIQSEFFIRELVISSTIVLMIIIVIRQTRLLHDSENLLKAEKKIHSLAYFDELTQLPNRRLLLENLQSAISECEDNKRFGALLFIDVDNFKTLNDTRGHEVGDLLLVAISSRLRSHLPKEDIVARIGGDEFVVLLPNLGSDKIQAIEKSELLATRIIKTVSQPYQIREIEYHSSVSIGIALLGECTNSVEDLLKQADSAMYQAKKIGHSTWIFFEPSMSTMLENRMLVESWMRNSAANNYELHFQLQTDIKGELNGAEVLLRLNHPTRGYIPPQEFIPIAEETGFIIPLGLWVINGACEQLKKWGLSEKFRNVHLAVNVSPRQFRDTDFVLQVKELFTTHNINPALLTLEITESLVIEAVEETILKMAELRSLGIKFSLDDFGTGQSSLTHLSRLPLDQLKIDKSFVANMVHQKSDSVIVQTIIGMANSLGLDVIAEGVESKEQLDFLVTCGCPHFQGFLFGRPVSVDIFEQLNA